MEGLLEENKELKNELEKIRQKDFRIIQNSHINTNSNKKEEYRPQVISSPSPKSLPKQIAYSPKLLK
jgi:hypothetical protein